MRIAVSREGCSVRFLYAALAVIKTCPAAFELVGQTCELVLQTSASRWRMLTGFSSPMFQKKSFITVRIVKYIELHGGIVESNPSSTLIHSAKLASDAISRYRTPSGLGKRQFARGSRSNNLVVLTASKHAGELLGFMFVLSDNQDPGIEVTRGEGSRVRKMLSQGRRRILKSHATMPLLPEMFRTIIRSQ